MGESESRTDTRGSYRGFLGAYWFAARRSRSTWFRLYVVVSAVLVAFITVLVSLAMIRWIARPSGLFGDRGLLAVVGILLVLPVAAPVLLVARRHRRAESQPTAGADRLVGLTGFGLVFGIYGGLVVAAPTRGSTSPLLVALDSLPTIAAIVPPVVGVGLFVLVARLTQPTTS